MMKNTISTPLRMTRIQKSHQVAAVGNRRVKQRLGWSSKNLSSSQTPLSRGTMLASTQITKRSMHGKPVFPMMMRKAPRRRGRIASWKDTMESGVRVNPRSLNMDAGVNIPLSHISALIKYKALSNLTTKLWTVRHCQLLAPMFRYVQSREVV